MRHGRSAYASGQCRCAICRAAQAAYMREFKRSDREPNEHGTKATYGNYGCRCDACRAGKATYAREWYARKKAGQS